MRPCPDHDRLNCPMTRINRVDGEGSIPCPIMLIGEAPGKSEDKAGRPFVGKSGSELTHLYLSQCAGIDRRNVFISNLVKCRTNDKDRNPTQKEIDACGKLLMDEILTVRPRFIGTIGRLSTQWIMGAETKMEKVHGFGYIFRELYGVEMYADSPCLVMPLYHPAYGLHNTPMMRHIMEDFTRFGRLVKGDKGVIWKPR